MIEITNKNLFYEKLKSGINLFLGAGFSVLKSPSGNRLPTVDGLIEEIKVEFNLKDSYGNDLERISSFLNRNFRKEYDAFLRKRYTVSDYNELYDVINLIKLNNVITTNIDNLIPSIIDNSKKYYISTISYNGPVKKDGFAVNYIPLHGDVLVPNRKLYFGKTELCNVEGENDDLFSMMHSELLKAPTLFWGYAFHDGSVLRILDKVLEQGKQDIWIQVRSDCEFIDYYKDLGLNVIIADTEELLEDIKSNIDGTDEIKDDGNNDFWNEYLIPSINKIEAMPIESYYEQGRTHWYYILSDYAYLTDSVNRIIDISIKAKNLIVVGLPLGGKTTLLMQIACRMNKPVYYVSELSISKAKMICNNISSSDAERIILIDNCAEDMEAYRELAKASNIKTIAAADDFMYESSKHILEDVSYERFYIPDIEELEAKRIFNSIPETIRCKDFRYRLQPTDKYSIFELIVQNVKNVVTREKIYQSLERVKKQDKESFEMVLLTAYLVYFKSALCTDTIIAYKNYKDATEVLEDISRIKAYLSDMIEEDLVDQDYFSLRSMLFAKYTHEVAIKRYKEEYRNIILQFVKNVPPSRIYNNNVFKKKAYDAELMYSLYNENDGDNIYEAVYKYDSSPYTLQQWALYKQKTGRNEEAFKDIEKARIMLPHNFSIKNSRAIILFEANRRKQTEEAKSHMLEAMAILEECYNSDKRKLYHAIKYAEFAIAIQKEYKDDSFVKKAHAWLKESFRNESEMPAKVKRLVLQLEDC